MNARTIHRACLAARNALPIVPEHLRPAIEAQLGKVERTANAAAEDFRKDLKAAAHAFESDMQPVCKAVVEALKAGDLVALKKLRSILPDLLAEVNRSPKLATVLIRQLGRELIEGLHGRDSETREVGFSANAADTAALQQWRSRAVFPTDFGSADIRGLSRELRLRSVFSARMTNAEAVQELANVVDEMLAGKINLATGRLRMMRKLAELGYDPEKGFPQDMAAVPPAERGSLRDLSSETRIDLMLETNQRIAANYGRMVAGNSAYARREYPAWELVRLYWRRNPRGSEESHSPGWDLRWRAAGESVDWEGALEMSFIALKDSPLWQALGDGEGGYADTLDNPFPPFAFNSGMAWREVSRAQCVALGLIEGEEVPGPMEGQLSPGDLEVKAALEKLGPEFRRELLEELEGIAA